MNPCKPLTRTALCILLAYATAGTATGEVRPASSLSDSLPQTTDSLKTPPSDSSRAGLQREKRLKSLIVTGSSAAVLGGTYLYLQKAWWSDSSRSFHFDDGRDWRYANNLDKVAHVLGGIIASNLYYDAFRWAGMEERKAAWAAFGMSTGIQLAIEVKDGFAQNWGFSVGDVLFGSLGSLMPVLRKNSPFLQNTDLKFSHWKRSDKYFIGRSIPPQAFHIDDYLNQTYWVSTNLKYITQGKLEWMPDWLCLSIGWGIEAESWDRHPVYRGTGGKPEIYLAPDIDLVRLFKPKRSFWKFTLKQLNYLKFPMPTLQLTQKVKLWPVYY
jgi:hypothetical protein